MRVKKVPLGPVHRETSEPIATVLVVEDEELLLLAVSRGLRKFGFAVVEARDGTEALNLIDTYVGTSSSCSST
jgi:Ni,Fe-hydrogenase III large subunit